MDSGPRRGAVLVLAVLALLALELLAHGALLLARQELAASRAGMRLLQARASAEAGYRDALLALSRSAPPTLAVGGDTTLLSGTLGPHPYRARITRLSREVWQVAGEGQAHGAGWWIGFGGPVWMLEPAGRLAAVAGVVEVTGGSTWSALGSASSFTIGETEPPVDACETWDALLDTLRVLRTLPAVAPAASGPGEPSLGILGPARLAGALSALAWEAGSPRPAERDGSCDPTDPLNLGDPADPAAPCGAYLPARWRQGSARLVGGAGQGLLAVSGDLTLEGTRWDGLLLVGGTLSLRGEARLLGAARAGAFILDSSSRVSGSACRVLRALDAALPALSNPVPMWAPIPLGPVAR